MLSAFTLKVEYVAGCGPTTPSLSSSIPPSTSSTAISSIYSSTSASVTSSTSTTSTTLSSKVSSSFSSTTSTTYSAAQVTPAITSTTSSTSPSSSASSSSVCATPSMINGGFETTVVAPWLQDPGSQDAVLPLVVKDGLTTGVDCLGEYYLKTTVAENTTAMIYQNISLCKLKKQYCILGYGQLASQAVVPSYEKYTLKMPVSEYCRAETVGGCLREQLLEERAEGEGKDRLFDCTRWGVRVKRYKYESQLLETEGITPDAYPQQWELSTKLDTFDDSRPRMVCISHHGVSDVKRLLRSELLIVMGMIIDRMGLPFSQNHLVFPILMVSLIGTQGRIIQAHFDGNKLYVKHSRLHEFREYDKETVDLFLRWLMNEPIGDTAVVGTEEEDGSCSSSQSDRYQESKPTVKGYISRCLSI
ncbi:hypothetical protein G7Y89_g767 [Cudoniella acicularis]|uniref:Uncharacterized protein n=1 Tax=Cudoniella acicularis TaxID=354080 RepID=A0A8H4W7M1_9HELO|nr:hypothetical protein G7Y89_g767 [Cudoniella acicularis]